MYFTLISLSTQWGPKAHTLFHCPLSGGPEAHTFFWVWAGGPHPVFTFTEGSQVGPLCHLGDSYNTYTKSEGGFTV